jgi:DnaJ-class molecular chaperone
MKKIIFTFSLFVLFSCGNSNETADKSSESSSGSINSMEKCPHCDGVGQRENTITGAFQDCSSCGGDGEVTSEENSHLSK